MWETFTNHRKVKCLIYIRQVVLFQCKFYKELLVLRFLRDFLKTFCYVKFNQKNMRKINKFNTSSRKLLLYKHDIKIIIDKLRIIHIQIH